MTVMTAREQTMTILRALVATVEQVDVGATELLYQLVRLAERVDLDALDKDRAVLIAERDAAREALAMALVRVAELESMPADQLAAARAADQLDAVPIPQPDHATVRLVARGPLVLISCAESRDSQIVAPCAWDQVLTITYRDGVVAEHVIGPVHDARGISDAIAALGLPCPATIEPAGARWAVQW